MWIFNVSSLFTWLLIFSFTLSVLPSTFHGVYSQEEARRLVTSLLLQLLVTKIRLLVSLELTLEYVRKLPQTSISSMDDIRKTSYLISFRTNATFRDHIVNSLTFSTRSSTDCNVCSLFCWRTSVNVCSIGSIFPVTFNRNCLSGLGAMFQVGVLC